MIIFKLINSKTFHICTECDEKGVVQSLCKKFKFFIGEENILKYNIKNIENTNNICKSCLKRINEVKHD